LERLRLRRHVHLPSIKLAPLAGVHNLLGVGNRRQPVESLAERVPNQGSRHSVMSACSAVDVDQQLSPLLDGDAAL
jgi:hypothetical protein